MPLNTEIQIKFCYREWGWEGTTQVQVYKCDEVFFKNVPSVGKSSEKLKNGINILVGQDGSGLKTMFCMLWSITQEPLSLLKF